MPEGAEYRREQRLERERGWAGGGNCCLVERSGGVGAPVWGGRGPKWGREECRKVVRRAMREEKENMGRKYEEDGRDRCKEKMKTTRGKEGERQIHMRNPFIVYQNGRTQIKIKERPTRSWVEKVEDDG